MEIDDYEQALKQARKIEDEGRKIVALEQIATECRRKGWGYDVIALEAYEDLRQVYREKGDRESEAMTLTNIVSTCYAVSDYTKAIQASEQTLTLLRELGDKQGELGTLLNLGQLYAYKEVNIPGAVRVLEQALQLQLEIMPEKAEETRAWLEEVQAQL